MNQNQCVPNWDLLDDVAPTIQQPLPPPQPVPRSLTSHSASLSASHDTSMQEFDMAELAWENGHLTMHGLGQPRLPCKNMGGAWTEKPSVNPCGTLESIVNQATYKVPSPGVTPIGACDYEDDLVPFLKPKSIHLSTPHTPVSMTMDALVPNGSNTQDMGMSKGVVGCSTRVGSCSTAGVGGAGYSDWSVSMSVSERVKRGPEKTCDQLRSISNNEPASTSLGASLDYTTKTVTFDDRDHDSVCHSRPQRERAEEEENRKKGNSSSAKRSRTAEIHNQSERKRRDKINQRMKTLQKLVPNSNKTDKASMLDEVIDYLKQLQTQLQLFNTMRSPASMMMPLAMQQQQLLQMSMMAPMGMGMGLGMGMNMDQMNMSMNPMGPANIPGISPTALNPAAFMSFAAGANGGDRVTPQPASMTQTDPISLYLASQSHSITMDAYNRIATMCQQLQQQQQQQSPNQARNQQ